MRPKNRSSIIWFCACVRTSACARNATSLAVSHVRGLTRCSGDSRVRTDVRRQHGDLGMRVVPPDDVGLGPDPLAQRLCVRGGPPSQRAPDPRPPPRIAALPRRPRSLRRAARARPPRGRFAGPCASAGRCPTRAPPSRPPAGPARAQCHAKRRGRARREHTRTLGLKHSSTERKGRRTQARRGRVGELKHGEEGAQARRGRVGEREKALSPGRSALQS